MHPTRQNGFDVYTLATPDGSAQADVIPELGAAMSSLRLNGRELLYCQPWFWERTPERTRGGFPFLFPACGRLERQGQAETWYWKHRLYRMKIHGFAMRVPWTVTDAEGRQALTLELRDTPETRGQYPFAFHVRLVFRVEPGRLLVEQSYANTGEVEMPYSAGFHPYFLTPEPGQGKEKTRVRFQAIRRLLYNERLTDLVDEAPPPVLPTAVTDPAVQETLTVAGSDNTTRLDLPGGPTICMRAVGERDPAMFPYVQLYTMPDRPFYCIEPWTGHPNVLNSVWGARRLAPGAEERAVLRVWTESADVTRGGP
jgi:galactose mutarotase-like enzyme